MNKKPKVLLIDDNRALIFAAEQVLQKNGFEVLTAFNGAEGLELAQKEKPNIIILDILMPEMDGYEVCRRLKSNPETARIQVIILSCKGEIDKSKKKATTRYGLRDVYDAYECGACDFLTKPVTARQLLDAVRDQLKLSALLGEAKY